MRSIIYIPGSLFINGSTTGSNRYNTRNVFCRTLRTTCADSIPKLSRISETRILRRNTGKNGFTKFITAFVQFHRIVNGFIVQGGDPTGTGRGGVAANGGTFEDEITRDLKHTGAGILCMANSGPNTNGSQVRSFCRSFYSVFQFYLTLAPCPSLDGKHTIFGRVATGMQVVKQLGNVQTDTQDRPLTQVKILRARPV